jgi:hypothetical protein
LVEVYIVLPILVEGPLLDTYIARRLPELMAMQRDDPDWAMNNPLWLPLFQHEREHTLAHLFGSYTGRFNMLGRKASSEQRAYPI